MTAFRARRNLLETIGEEFSPPVFKPNTTLYNRTVNWLRRAIDLQANTIWRDLRNELRNVEGDLLDIGCGAQVYRALLPADINYRGIDTKDARDRFGYDIPDTHYFTGSDWGIPEASIDTAICTEVLEHIAEPKTLLAQAHNALRPGGCLIMTVPFAARWHFIPYDYWRYTPSGLDLLLTAAGFEDVRVMARGNPLTVACYKAMALPLALLLGTRAGPMRVVQRALGIVSLPIVGILAAIANLTLDDEWGDDCLGYTVTARRPCLPILSMGTAR